MNITNQWKGDKHDDNSNYRCSNVCSSLLHQNINQQITIKISPTLLTAIVFYYCYDAPFQMAANMMELGRGESGGVNGEKIIRGLPLKKMDLQPATRPPDFDPRIRKTSKMLDVWALGACGWNTWFFSGVWATGAPEAPQSTTLP